MFEMLGIRYLDILDVPRLRFQEQTITTLVGSSGSGKTTLLKMLNKMISPTDGTILYDGVDLRQTDSVTHRRRVTMLSQNPVLFDGTVRENLTAGLVFQNRRIPEENRLCEILEQVRLNKALDSPAGTLSGGEKQRLALGRLIVLDPEVYLLDEPSSALDDCTEEQIIGMMATHVKKRKKSMIMVTHSNPIAEKYSESIFEMSCGQCSCRR